MLRLIVNTETTEGDFTSDKFTTFDVDIPVLETLLSSNVRNIEERFYSESRCLG